MFNLNHLITWSRQEFFLQQTIFPIVTSIRQKEINLTFGEASPLSNYWIDVRNKSFGFTQTSLLKFIAIIF